MLLFVVRALTQPCRAVRCEAVRNPSAPARRPRPRAITRTHGRNARRRAAYLIRLNHRAPTCMISRPSQRSCVESQIACVGRPLQSQLMCVRNRSGLRVGPCIIARRYTKGAITAVISIAACEPVRRRAVRSRLSGCHAAAVDSRNGSSGRVRNLGDIAPCAKGGIARRTMLIGTEVMTAELEVVVDPAVTGEKALHMTR